MATRLLSLTYLIILCVNMYGQNTPKYKSMMNDLSINFYEVVNEADSYFKNIDLSKSGTGWKDYQRWKNINEGKFYPSGERKNYNPRLAYETFERIKRETESSSRNLFSNGWVNYGPDTLYPMAGINTFGHGLGRLEDVWVNPNDANLIYTSSRSGGFFKSINGGQTFTGSTTLNLPATGVNTFTVNPNNANEIYINVKNSRNDYSHGIYKSVDGGLSWTPTNFVAGTSGFGGLGTTFEIYELVMHPTTPNLIFAGTNAGIFRSTNGFSTWTQISTASDVWNFAFHPTNANIIYAYDDNAPNLNNIIKSTNGGVSFAQAGALQNNNGSTWVRLSTSHNCSSCVYVASESGIYKSINEGSSFTFLNTPDAPGGFAVNDTDTSKLMVGYIQLYHSTNGGLSWNPVTSSSLPSSNGTGTGLNKFLSSTNYTHVDVRMLRYVNGVYYVATDGFVSKSSNNGTTWTKMHKGLGVRENYKLGISQSDNTRVTTGSQDVGSNLFKGNSWLKVLGGDGMESVFHPLNPQYFILSNQQGLRTKYIDGGIAGSSVNPPGSPLGDWEAPLAYLSNNPMTYLDFRKKIYRGQNFGNTIDSLGVPSTFNGSDIKVAEVAENDNNIIIIGRINNIEKSTNGGLNFESINNNLPTLSISDVCFDPKNDNTIIVVNEQVAADGNKIFISNNGGASWSNITYNLYNMPISSVVIDHTPAKNIYVGAEIGIYTKPMNGTTWTLYNTNYPNVTTNELEINYGANTIKAATWGNGLLENHLVGRSFYPSIVNTAIDTPPTLTTPMASIPQHVTSKVHYIGTLSNVFLRYSTGSPIFDKTLIMCNTMDSTWKTIYPIPTQVAGTKVYFKVFAVGMNNDTSETYKFMYEVRPFVNTSNVCAASGTSTSSSHVINVNLSPGNIINNTTVANSAYAFYSTPVNVKQNATYTLTLSNSGTNKYCAAWLDFNGDEIFELSERILYKAPTTGTTAVENFTIPVHTQKNKNLRMRVRVSGINSLEACGTSSSGEVEDYIIVAKDCKFVSTTQDSIYGSLRDAIYCAASGDTIRFDECFAGHTIYVKTPIIISKNLVILGSSLDTLTISSIVPSTSAIPNVFNIAAGANVIFKNLKIDGGAGPEGSAILNNGNLTLSNVAVTDGGNSGILSIVKNQNGGTVKVEQVVKID